MHLRFTQSRTENNLLLLVVGKGRALVREEQTIAGGCLVIYSQDFFQDLGHGGAKTAICNLVGGGGGEVWLSQHAQHLIV